LCEKCIIYNVICYKKLEVQVMKKYLQFPLCLFALSIFVSLVSCSGGGSGTMGTANILLTDSPACGYQNVFVTVDHVEISTDGNSWTIVPVSSGVQQPIDLLNLTNGTLQSLGEAPLVAGTYNQLRLVLKANGSSAPWANSLVLTSNPSIIPLSTPSSQQSGYKIKGPFTVQAGTLADLVIDFNACKSIVVAGQSGKYLLKPVVAATAMVVSGSITGTTVPSSQVYAEQQSSTGPIIVIGSVADSITGAFTLSPILESSSGGTVDVVVVSPTSGVPPVPGYATDIVQGVPVTAGGVTPLGTITPATSMINAASGTVTVAGSLGAANLVADQTVTSTARTYEIASTLTITTGSYSISLAVSGPWLGTFNSTLPITFTEDTAPADVGRYSITATDAAGTVLTQPANVSAGSDIVNFTMSP
jgi:Domain of unknown function (DUF4382)